MALPQQLDAVFVGDEGPIPALQFGTYLRRFAQIYSAVIVLGLDREIDPFDISFEDIYYNRVLMTAIASVAVRERAVREIEGQALITAISKSSPLEMILTGSVSALLLAVILSDGKFELSWDRIKVELPPLGVGLQALEGVLKYARGTSGLRRDAANELTQQRLDAVFRDANRPTKREES